MAKRMRALAVLVVLTLVTGVSSTPGLRSEPTGVTGIHLAKWFNAD